MCLCSSEGRYKWIDEKMHSILDGAMLCREREASTLWITRGTLQAEGITNEKTVGCDLIHSPTGRLGGSWRVVSKGGSRA